MICGPFPDKDSFCIDVSSINVQQHQEIGVLPMEMEAEARGILLRGVLFLLVGSRCCWELLHQVSVVQRAFPAVGQGFWDFWERLPVWFSLKQKKATSSNKQRPSLRKGGAFRLR